MVQVPPLVATSGTAAVTTTVRAALTSSQQLKPQLQVCVCFYWSLSHQREPLLQIERKRQGTGHADKINSPHLSSFPLSFHFSLPPYPFPPSLPLCLPPSLPPSSLPSSLPTTVGPSLPSLSPLPLSPPSLLSPPSPPSLSPLPL